MQLSEQEYWQLIRQGDKAAFEQVFRQFYKALGNYACSVIKDKDEAEEVVQNMFFNLWNRRQKLDINTSLKSYLYRAVHNDCLNRIKHAKVRSIYAEDYKSTVSAAYDDSLKTLNAKELNKKIHSAIDELPEQCGLVFRLSRFDNLKYNEIATQLDISVKTVENHMGKALKLMREKLKDYLPLVLWLLYMDNF
ncbi:MAG: RNA polymerase sigma-70 factor [Bacteroidia bacterium]|nr:RNA polymerase sigma-70 factor [Bacteroidia bacterium]